MRTTIELPQVGESVTEGVIGKWLVEPGQRVEKYDPLVEVVTDKVSMEAPSPYAGVFVRALVEEGETVPMGEPICEMEIDAATGAAEEPADEPSPRPSPIGRGREEVEGDADEGADGDAGEDEADETEEPSPRPSPIGRGREETEADGDEAAALEEEESAEQGKAVAADAESDAEPDMESDADTEEDGDAGKVGGAWAMPAAQDEQAGGDSEGAAQADAADSAPQEDGVEAAGDPDGAAQADAADSAPQEEGDAAAGDAERPAAEHPFEFVGSVRSVGPTGSGERGEGRPDAAQDAAIAAGTESVAQESAAASATEPGAQEEAIAAEAAEPEAQEAVAAEAVEPEAQEAVAAEAAEPEAQEAGASVATESVAQEAADEAAATEPTAQEEVAAPIAPIAEAVAPRADAEPDRRHVVSPLVARLSAQYGIDLSTVRGTGTGGRVTSQDLLNAVSAAEAQREAAEASASEQAEAAAPSDAPPQEEQAVAPVAEAAEQAEAVAPAAPSQEDAAAAPVAEAAEQAAESAAPGAPPQEEESAAPVAEASEQAEPVAPGAPLQEGAAPVAEAAERAESVAPGAPPQEEQFVAPGAAQADEGVSLLPVTPIRRAIAEHMARSASEIPAAWAMVEADATGLVRARDARKEAFERERGVALTYLPFLANAAAQALRERPKLNARWDDGRIILNNRVNLSIAVATDAGLMVPVLRDADALSVAETAVALRRLTEAARNGALTLDDVQGGTFTLNNTGALGSVVSVPIINHPQAAILTTEAIVKRPVVIHGDAIAARAMMNLCISFDHRVCDGADAAGFLRAVKDRLEALDESAALG